MQIAYSTSFNTNLYKEGGKEMVESFKKNQKEDLIIGFNGCVNFTKGQVKMIDIRKTPFYTQWMQKFNEENELFHIFKKVATLNTIISTFVVDVIVFLNCRCKIEKTIPQNEIIGVLKDVDMYNEGNLFPAAFNLKNGGKKSIQEMSEKLLDGESIKSTESTMKKSLFGHYITA